MEVSDIADMIIGGIKVTKQNMAWLKQQSLELAVEVGNKVAQIITDEQKFKHELLFSRQNKEAQAGPSRQVCMTHNTRQSAQADPNLP